ncbi:catalase family protein [uncultured Sphingomonas sp.]|uniref:catalase family protein n=1 Tax=uncultured Sphingomonas sp. TaxID=158754 RepID=UPI0025F79545|nr:catalase family protein [uncultured Sphingomonas sp.]
MHPAATPVRYNPDVEQHEEGEAETIQGLKDTFTDILETTSKDYGHAVRGVHAKGHAVVTGTIEVLGDLPSALAQGLFARPGTYDAVLRFSTNPGDILDDSVVVPRGLALKVLDVDTPDGAQDFVMADGPAFFAGSAKFFLQNVKLLAATTDRVEWLKKAQSLLLRGVENTLEAVGLESATLKSLGGTPSTHPLGRTYYSQTAFRYGEYVAKFSVAPLSPNLTALADAKVAVAGRPDALREEIAEVLAEGDGVWELRVQLCTDLDTMPVEDPTKVWDEGDSPFVPVARITVPAQPTWVNGVSQQREDRLLFTPWHCLDAHRPLGAVNRVRKPVYELSSGYRSRFNGCPIHNMRTAQEVDA